MNRRGKSGWLFKANLLRLEVTINQRLPDFSS
jgi:hypothetical protein